MGPRGVAHTSGPGVVRARASGFVGGQVEEELPALSNLQLRVVHDGQLEEGDLYGKVLKAVRPNVVYLRLTSVPAEARARLEVARAGAAVLESAMVSRGGR